jgi:AraC family transcriptional regulator
MVVRRRCLRTDCRERLKRVYENVEEHLDNRLSLSDVAAITSLSPYHFSRSFKQAIGVVRRTDLSLALIAREAGFADPSHGFRISP